MRQRSRELAPVDDHEVPDLHRALEAGRRQRRRLEREAERAEEALTLLRRGGLQALLAKPGRQLMGLPSCMALLRRSWEMGPNPEDSRRMVELARWAVFTAENLKPERYGAELAVDLQARALGDLGNAYRQVGDLLSAEQALGTASFLALRGSGDPLLRGRLLEQKAVLCADRRRFAEAFDLLEDARRLYYACSEPQLIGRVLLDRGAYAARANDPEAAIHLEHEALALIDHQKHPRYALTAAHNMAWSLAEAGRLLEARDVLRQNWKRYRRDARHVLLLRRTWLEGKIHAGCEELDAAEQCLTEARMGLDDAGKLDACAVASLDLAAVWLRQGRSRAARDLAKQAAEVFVSLGIAREALAAMVLLQDASRMQAAKATLWQYLLDQL